MNRYKYFMDLRERKIFHRCECLNQDFYEGDELPEAFYDENLAVYTFKGFKFNLNDVCLNPEIITFQNKGVTYDVEIAEKREGCFINGYWVYSNTGATGHKPNFIDDGFKSREEAIADVFKTLMEFNYIVDKEFCKRMYYKYRCVQLSLFD